MKFLNIYDFRDKNITVSIIVNVILSVFFYMNQLFFWREVPNNWEKIIALFGLIMLIVQIFSLIIRGTSFLDYRYWFSVLCFVFTYGRIVLLALGLDDKLIWKNLSSNYTELQQWEAGLLSLTCIQCLFSGMMFSKRNNNQSSSVLRNPNFNLYYIGLILVIALLPFKIITDYQNYVIMKVVGSYSQADVNGVVGNLALLFPLGFILIIFSRRLSTKKCVAFLVTYSIIMLFFSIYTGDRRNVITSILCLFLTYLFTYKPKIRIKKIFIYALVSVLVLYLMVIVRELRSNSLGSFSNVIEYIENNSISLMDIVWDSFAEYGITYYTYANAIKFYPQSISYFYGTTYLLWIFISIPGIGVILPGINDLTSTSKYPESILNYSVGGSFGQEAYANFGFFAGLFLFIIGVFLGKYVLDLYKTNNEKKQMYYFVFIYFLMSLPRASFIEFSRQIVWSICFIEVCTLVFAKRRVSNYA